jgi:integrase
MFSYGEAKFFAVLQLTGLRGGEIVGAKVSELDDGVWTIRGDVAKGGRIVVEGRMKSGRQQMVYLSRQARALFDRALRECANEEYVFPAAPLPMSKEKCTSVHIDRRSVSRCDGAVVHVGRHRGSASARHAHSDDGHGSMMLACRRASRAPSSITPLRT